MKTYETVLQFKNVEYRHLITVDVPHAGLVFEEMVKRVAAENGFDEYDLATQYSYFSNRFVPPDGLTIYPTA